MTSTEKRYRVIIEDLLAGRTLREYHTDGDHAVLVLGFQAGGDGSGACWIKQYDEQPQLWKEMAIELPE